MFSNPLFYFAFNTILSLTIIILAHYCWNYLKETYSTKKTRNLVNSQIEKYKKMVEEIQQGGSQNNELFSEEEKENMNNDLLSFANSLTNENL
jgi:hypothetical protein